MHAVHFNFYPKVFNENTYPGGEVNFEAIEDTQTHVPYDYKSIMHYDQMVIQICFALSLHN